MVQRSEATYMNPAHDAIIACVLVTVMLLLMVVAAFAIRVDIPDPVLSGGDRPDMHRCYGSRLFLPGARDGSDRTRGIVPLARVAQFLYRNRMEGLLQLFNMLRGDRALFSKRCVIR